MKTKILTKEEIFQKRHKNVLALYGTIWPSELKVKRITKRGIILFRYGEEVKYI